MPRLRVAGFALALCGLLSLLGGGCGSGPETPDGAALADGGPDGAGDTGLPDGGDADAGADAGTDGGIDAPRGECEVGVDCLTRHGPPPCGTWECHGDACEVVCSGCTDADRDGFGPEAACGGPDCDDGDDRVLDRTACYTGAAGTDGIGVCRAGLQRCDAADAPCVGQVTPSGEACDGADDDCDGRTDEALGLFHCGNGACARTVPACAGGRIGECTPGPAGVDDDCDGADDDCDGAIDEVCTTRCVWVTPTGNDATADGSLGRPYRNIGSAIDAARPAVGEHVCVAAGTSCSARFTYDENVDMRDGVQVYGSYETTAAGRCTGWTTRITSSRAEGVVFGPVIASTTILDGFEIQRADTVISAGVTVDGATGAVISDVRIETDGGAGVAHSFGVNVVGGGYATVRRSLIYGGHATMVSAGVRAVGSRVTVSDNCRDLDVSGRCDDDCGPLGSTDPGIRGPYPSPTTAIRGHAVYLENASGSVIESSALCGHAATVGSTVFVTGSAEGVVLRGNLMNGWGGRVISLGVWLEDCGDDAPWIVDNHRILGDGADPAAVVQGIRSVGACHPVIDSNRSIAGGTDGLGATTNGVYCGATVAGASRCVVVGNVAIEGSAYGRPAVSVGLRCDYDACNRIENNDIAGGGGDQPFGLLLHDSGPVVSNNRIVGGCGGMSALGVFSDNSYARLENNRIHGGSDASCRGGDGSTAALFIGLHVHAAAGPNEIDVHSNVIDGQGEARACRSEAISIAGTAGAMPTGPAGIYRNNVLRAGLCAMARYGFAEEHPESDPRVVENNDFDPTGGPTALYVDLETGHLTTAARVDALGDIRAGGNISADPSFVAYPDDLHLRAGSMCDGAGTATGAPPVDMDGDPRAAPAPDIGADEI